MRRPCRREESVSLNLDKAIGVGLAQCRAIRQLAEALIEFMERLGIVVIGRNEGERLRYCLHSLPSDVPVVYVDSGSDDDSVAFARSMHAVVVELDPARPFSAARARNEGFCMLVGICPDVALVQFLDGDCSLRANWLAAAIDVLGGRNSTAAVAGRIHERFSQASIYNRVGELEWNMAGSGDVNEVGGIFMIRRSAFDEVSGFDPTVTAGEEPELCLRLRRHGWRIRRLDVDMAWHDLGITRFAQWWGRQLRTGYGSLDVASRFDLPGFRRIVLRARAWAAWLTLCGGCAAAALVTADPAIVAVTLVLVALWPLQLLRIAAITVRRGQPIGVALAYAALTMVSYGPQLLGQAQGAFDRIAHRSARVIEYKRRGSGANPTTKAEVIPEGRRP